MTLRDGSAKEAAEEENEREFDRMVAADQDFLQEDVEDVEDVIDDRGEKEEKLTARAVLVPFLQAEEDRRFHRAWKERTAMEDKIMEGVDGWKSGENVYSSTWMPPHNTLTPRII